jgi:hypothetical protein
MTEIPKTEENMKRYLIFIIFFISVIFTSVCAKNKTNEIEWNEGFAFRDGKAVYFDPTKLYTIEFYVSHKFLNNQIKYKPIFPGGFIGWTARTNLVYIYSMPVNSPGDYIVESKKVILYTVSNESIYLRDTNTDWEKMEFRLIATNPAPQVDFLIYLKSRWFEGEYNVYEP